MEILTSIWREACRHIEIEESVDRIAQLLTSHLPATLVIVRRLDLERSELDTVTTGVCRPGPVPERTRTAYTSEQLNMVLQWCATGELVHDYPQRANLAALVAPPDVQTPIIAGPLVGDAGPLGVLVLLLPPKTALDSHQMHLMQEMLEPFSVALANDSRLHELAQLQEALEADKRALLSRLDRQDVTESIIGQDTGMRLVMDRVDQVAATDAPVLLLGETGTGKEVIARAIHARSHRAGAPIVRVNCGALPPGLVDSELFGHERGSFTGAVGTRRGWFERADGGTLFLDEIGELPLDAQVRLLRILQDGTFSRVGGQKSLTVDVRIVAATHRDLQTMVARREFREDLWYRIGVFPIRIPPLRERLEDIPLLAAHFAWKAGVRLGGAPLSLAPQDVSALLSYAWPGNVRELAAVIERAAILGNGRSLNITGALGVTTTGPTVVSQQIPVGCLAPLEQHVAAQEESAPKEASCAVTSLDDAVRVHIERALVTTHGRVDGPFGAAKLLQINPHTLRARMRKLNIDWRQYRHSESQA